MGTTVFFLMLFAWSAVWVWTLIDCVKYESREGNDRVVWLIIVLLGYGLGAIVYLLARRPQRIQELGR